MWGFFVVFYLLVLTNLSRTLRADLPAPWVYGFLRVPARGLTVPLAVTHSRI